MAIAANSLTSRRLGPGWGSLERVPLLSNIFLLGGSAGQEAATQTHASQRFYPLGFCCHGCCYRNTRRTHWAEIKHPSRMRMGVGLCLMPRSPWQHAGSMAASNTRGLGILTPSRGSGRLGALLLGSPALLASAGAGRSGRAHARWSWERLPSPPAPSPPLEG